MCNRDHNPIKLNFLIFTKKVVFMQSVYTCEKSNKNNSHSPHGNLIFLLLLKIVFHFIFAFLGCKNGVRFLPHSGNIELPFTLHKRLAPTIFFSSRELNAALFLVSNKVVIARPFVVNCLLVACYIISNFTDAVLFF